VQTLGELSREQSAWIVDLNSRSGKVFLQVNADTRKYIGGALAAGHPLLVCDRRRKSRVGIHRKERMKLEDGQSRSQHQSAEEEQRRSGSHGKIPAEVAICGMGGRAIPV
jgi:hypothetical protein